VHFRTNEIDLELEHERSNKVLDLRLSIKETKDDGYLVSASNWHLFDVSAHIEVSIYEVFGYDTYDFWVIGESLLFSFREDELDGSVESILPSDLKSTFSRAKEGRIFIPGLTASDGSVAYAIPTESSQESRSIYLLLRELAQKHNLACLVRFLPTEQVLVPILDPAAHGSVSYRIFKVAGGQNPFAQTERSQAWHPFTDDSPF